MVQQLSRRRRELQRKPRRARTNDRRRREVPVAADQQVHVAGRAHLPLHAGACPQREAVRARLPGDRRLHLGDGDAHGLPLPRRSLHGGGLAGRQRLVQHVVYRDVRSPDIQPDPDARAGATGPVTLHSTEDTRSSNRAGFHMLWALVVNKFAQFGDEEAFVETPSGAVQFAGKELFGFGSLDGAYDVIDSLMIK